MRPRRSHSTKSNDQSQVAEKPLPPANDTGAERYNGHPDHSHSHSIFSPHPRSHGENGHGVERIMDALHGAGDRGSRITLVGLFSNVMLTAAKGAAGWYMHSASLLADAGHSLSDLLGDFVTLLCWKLSRKQPSTRYPFGFAKFETLGTTTVSLLLIGGSLGIGYHSYYLLIEALGQTTAALTPGPLRDMLQFVTSVVPHIPGVGQAHTHTLDPNAAWFAAVSIVSKEWLYRITKVVAEEEKSPVLLANAIHHRSDAYSSIVALIAILGSWWFPGLPLDPIGGLIVSLVILRQGLGIFTGAWGQLTDVGVSPRTHEALIRVLDPLIASPSLGSSRSDMQIDPFSPRILAIRHLRARRAGSLMFVDLTADVDERMTVTNSSELEEKITSTLKKVRKEIAEVRVKFHPVQDDYSRDSLQP